MNEDNNKECEDRGKAKLRELYPKWSEEQLDSAISALYQHVEIALRVYEDIRKDPMRYGLFKRRLKILRANKHTIMN